MCIRFMSSGLLSERKLRALIASSRHDRVKLALALEDATGFPIVVDDLEQWDPAPSGENISDPTLRRGRVAAVAGAGAGGARLESQEMVGSGSGTPSAPWEQRRTAERRKARAYAARVTAVAEKARARWHSIDELSCWMTSGGMPWTPSLHHIFPVPIRRVIRTCLLIQARAVQEALRLEDQELEAAQAAQAEQAYQQTPYEQAKAKAQHQGTHGAGSECFEDGDPHPDTTSPSSGAEVIHDASSARGEQGEGRQARGVPLAMAPMALTLWFEVWKYLGFHDLYDYHAPLLSLADALTDHPGAELQASDLDLI